MSQSNASSRSNILSLSSNQQEQFDYPSKNLQNYNKLTNKLKNIINKKLNIQTQINDPEQLCDRIEAIILANPNHNPTKQQINLLIKQFQDFKHYNKRVKNIVELLQTKIKFNQNNHNNNTNHQRLSSSKNTINNNVKYHPPLPNNFQNKNIQQRKNTQEPFQFEQTQLLKKRNKFYQDKISQIANELKVIKGQLNGICGVAKQSQQISEIEKASSNKKSQSNQIQQDWILMPNGQWISQKQYTNQSQQIKTSKDEQINQQVHQLSKQNQQQQPKNQSNEEDNLKIEKLQKFKKSDAVFENINMKFAESEWIEEFTKQRKKINNLETVPQNNNKFIHQNKLNKTISSDRSERNSDISKNTQQRKLNNGFIKKNNVQSHDQQNIKISQRDNLNYENQSRQNFLLHNTTPTLIDDLNIIPTDLIDQMDEINIPEQVDIQEIQKTAQRAKKMKEYAQKLQTRIAAICKAKNIEQIFKNQEEHRQTGFTRQSSQRQNIQKRIKKQIKNQDHNHSIALQSDPNCALQQKTNRNQESLNGFQSQNTVSRDSHKENKWGSIKVNNQESNFSIFHQNKKTALNENHSINRDQIIQQYQIIIPTTTKQTLLEMKNVQSKHDIPEFYYQSHNLKAYHQNNKNPSIHLVQNSLKNNQINQHYSQYSTQQNLRSGLIVNSSASQSQKNNTIHMIKTSKTINQSQNQSSNRQNIHLSSSQQQLITDKNISFMSFRDNANQLENKSQKIDQQQVEKQNNPNSYSKSKSNSKPSNITKNIANNLNFNDQNQQNNRKSIVSSSRPKTPPHCIVQFQQIKRKSKNASQLFNNESNNNHKEQEKQDISSPKLQNSYSVNVKYMSPVQKLRSFHSPQPNLQPNLSPKARAPMLKHLINNNTINKIYSQPIYQQVSTFHSIVSPYKIPKSNRVSLNSNIIQTQQYPPHLIQNGNFSSKHINIMNNSGIINERQVYSKNINNNINNKSFHQINMSGNKLNYNISRSPNHLSPLIINNNNNDYDSSFRLIDRNRQSFKRGSRSKSSKGILITSPKHNNINNVNKQFWKQYEYKHINQNVTTYY